VGKGLPEPLATWKDVFVCEWEAKPSVCTEPGRYEIAPPVLAAVREFKSGSCQLYIVKVPEPWVVIEIFVPNNAFASSEASLK
jgi:hypothetical protein